MRRTLLTTLALLSLLTAAACETVQGAGRDMQNAGEAVVQGSNEVQSEM